MTTITKDEFDNLPAVLKAKFEANGDEYTLIEEDVSGLKKNAADILKEKKALETLYEGLDPKEARAALAASAKAEDERLKAEGQFEELKKKLEDRHAAELQTATAREQSLLSNLKRERLQNYLVEKGVLADRAAYAFVDIGEQIELASDDSGFSLKLKGGIGDAKELETVVEGLKAKSPFLFAADGASGSGASGSGNDGGGRAAKTVTRAQWDAASSEQRTDWGPAVAVTD